MRMLTGQWLSSVCARACQVSIQTQDMPLQEQLIEERICVCVRSRCSNPDMPLQEQTVTASLFSPCSTRLCSQEPKCALSLREKRQQLSLPPATGPLRRPPGPLGDGEGREGSGTIVWVPTVGAVSGNHCSSTGSSLKRGAQTEGTGSEGQWEPYLGPWLSVFLSPFPLASGEMAWRHG